MVKITLVGLFSLLILLYFFNRGFAYYDEGYILHAAERVVKGELPYRDFDLIYTPGAVLLLSVFFKFLGVSILTGRILTILIGIVTSVILYLAGLNLTKNKLTATLPVLIYLAWGPSHINFPWPSLFAFSAGFFATYLLTAEQIFWSGIFVGLTFVFKQNFGMGLLVSSLASLYFVDGGKLPKNWLSFLKGSGLVFLLFGFYLQLTNSFPGYVDNFYYYTIEKILLGGIASTNFPQGFKAVFYLLPAIFAVTALIYTRSKKSLWPYPVFVLIFYLSGIRPTTDYPHLVILLSGTGLVLAVLVFTAKTRFLKTGWTFVAIALIILGFHTALFKNYYRWDSPLFKQDYFLTQTKARIFVDAKFSRIIPQTTEFIRKNTSEDDYIFIYPNAPMFYLLSSRRNPTRLINMVNLLHTPDQERKVVEVLIRKKVRLIITNGNPSSWNYRIVKNHILTNYSNKNKLGEFTFWLRK